MNTTEAARRIGVNQSRIRQLIGAGRLKAEKMGRDWLIRESELRRFLATERPAGRPRKPRP